jgi:hypothetical protein
MNNTTRRHPRTLREAFPRDAQHACSIERHRAPMRPLEACLAWGSIIGMCILLAYSVVA